MAKQRKSDPRKFWTLPTISQLKHKGYKLYRALPEDNISLVNTILEDEERNVVIRRSYNFRGFQREYKFATGVVSVSRLLSQELRSPFVKHMGFEVAGQRFCTLDSRFLFEEKSTIAIGGANYTLEGKLRINSIWYPLNFYDSENNLVARAVRPSVFGPIFILVAKSDLEPKILSVIFFICNWVSR